jgi:hypothetical protein
VQKEISAFETIEEEEIGEEKSRKKMYKERCFLGFTSFYIT